MGSGVSRWPTVKLGDVLDLHLDSVPVNPATTYNISGVYSFGRGLLARSPLSGGETTYKTFNRLHAGDIVISQLKAWEGAIALIPPAFDGWYLSPQFATFRARNAVADPRYIEWFCRRPQLWEQLERGSRGMGARRNSVSPKQFLSTEMPLPPIEVQRRVVEKLNRLAILQDRAKRASLGNTAAIGLLPTRLRSVRFAALAARLQPVPLGSIGEVRLGKMLSGNRTDSEDGIPYLRNANVQWDFLDLTSVYRMQLPKEQVATYSLRPGDVLVCEGGDIGKAAIWSGEIDLCLFQKALHRIRLDQSLVAPRFLLHHIMWCAESGQFADVKTQTTIAHLTGVQLKAHPLLLPSIHEQQKMVHDLDRVTRLVDRARRSATAASEATVALKCSALAGVLGD